MSRDIHANGNTRTPAELEQEKLAAQLCADAGKGVEEMLYETVPDAVDAACSLWGVVAPAVMTEIIGLASELRGADEMSNSPFFNFIDSAALLARGSAQLRDVYYNETHRPHVTLLKGVINMGAGTGLGVLTGLALSAGATAAAILTAQVALVSTMGIAMLQASEEMGRAFLRLNVPEYWMKDSLSELNTLQTVLIKKQEAKLAMKKETWTNVIRKGRETEPLNKKERAYEWAIERNEKTLEKLKQREEDLIKTIRGRAQSSERCNIYFNECLKDSKYLEKMKYTALFNSIHKDPSPLTFDSSPRAKTLRDSVRSTLRNDLKRATADALYLGLLFTGTLLLMLPGGQIPGTVLLGVFAAAFVKKNAHYMPAIAKASTTVLPEMYHSATKSLVKLFSNNNQKTLPDPTAPTVVATAKRP